MIRPEELASAKPFGPWSCRGSDVWKTFRAASEGDAAALRRLLGADPNLHRTEYFYTQPIDLAVRGGHAEAVRLLLEAGADPASIGLSGDSLTTAARDRGHEGVARLLQEACDRQARLKPEEDEADHQIHAAAEEGDIDRVRALLDFDPQLVHRCDRKGGTPLHRAVAGQGREVAGLLLDRGADIHALHGRGPGSESGYAATDFQPIDLALWNGPYWGVRGDTECARLLLDRGADMDLAIASALGEEEEVTRILDEDPRRIEEARPSGKRALSAAVEFGRESIVRLLLDRGADPNWPDGETAPRGAALHAAAQLGNRPLVELLLDHGADPNSSIDSSGSATFAARNREVRELLLSKGGSLDPYDLIWLGEDEQAVRMVSQDPQSANAGCGGVFAAACKLGKRDLVLRLLEAGARVPAMVTECRSYLLSDPDLLQLLLQSGMDPNLPNWQRATPLHSLCGRDVRGRPRKHRRECAAILLEAGATLSARDEEYRSTPLAWAARTGVQDMVELLLERGAPTNLPDDESWATPLAWADKRGHAPIADLLRKAGAQA